MLNISKRVFAALLVTGFAAPAVAADMYEPVVEPQPQVVYQQVETGGWYLRGDLGYRWSKFRGADYITYGICDTGCGPVPLPGSKSFDFGDLKGAMSFGGGVGYQVNNYFRTDVTADYWFKSKFNGQTSDGVNVSTDTSSYSALLLLANAYVDLGTWHRVTPYVGAGIGGAYVKWDNLRNQFGNVDDSHKGGKEWRFAYALMAGASYCITKNLQFDAGYRFTRVNGGKMFDYVDSSAGGPGAGPGYDKGFNVCMKCAAACATSSAAARPIAPNRSRWPTSRPRSSPSTSSFPAHHIRPPGLRRAVFCCRQGSPETLTAPQKRQIR